MASFVTQGAASATAAEAAPTVEEPLCRNYVDVHCHIVHEKFVGEEDAVSGVTSIPGMHLVHYRDHCQVL